MDYKVPALLALHEAAYPACDIRGEGNTVGNGTPAEPSHHLPARPYDSLGDGAAVHFIYSIGRR